MKKTVFIFYLTFFAVSAFSQAGLTFDAGISECVKEIQRGVPSGTKLVVLNIRSSSPQLSEYILEELIDHLIRSGSFTVVDRSNLDIIRNELQFNLSGEVSDETAQSIGKMLGAQTIVSGSIDQFGDVFRLRVRAIAVETAAFQASRSVNIQRDRFLNSLASDASSSEANNHSSPQPSHSQPSQITPPVGESRTMLPDFLLNP
jgi:TolB-like protein